MSSTRSVASFSGEIWTLFALGVVFTLLRIVARIRIVGIRHLQADDYLVCVALLFFAGETGIAYYGGSGYYRARASGRLNPSPSFLQTLPSDDSRLDLWVGGQRAHFASWFVYTGALWTLKASLLILYLRLTTGLAGSYRIRILVGFGMLTATWIAVTIVPFAACQPFSRYWTTDPFPTPMCRPAVSPPIVFITYFANVVTDLYLMSIPLPMLWETTMKRWKKYGLVVLFSGGLIIVVFATVRLVLIVTDPVNGAPVSGTWSIRETFIAIIVTNAPLVFSLVRSLLGPAFGSTYSGGTHRNGAQYKAKITTDGEGADSSVAMRTFGNGGTRHSRRSRGGNQAIMTNQIFSESEERIVYGGDRSPPASLVEKAAQPADAQA